jgi:hypothetical protein
VLAKDLHRTIFFITTYFSDFILVPSRSQSIVTTTLEQRGFVFSKSADAFVSQLSPSSPSTRHHKRNVSSSTSSAESGPPITPPAQSVPELKSRTFATLKKHGIEPKVDDSLRLILCAGSKDPDPELARQLQEDLLQVLMATTPASLPQATARPESPTPGSTLDFSTGFLSLTITANDAISVLLEHSLADRLGSSLLGAKQEEDILIPITLDLRDLSMQATGIVCGVAGRLAKESKSDGSSPGTRTPTAVDLSFLSTARAGTVIVKVSELERAVKALQNADDEVINGTTKDHESNMGKIEGLGIN